MDLATFKNRPKNNSGRRKKDFEHARELEISLSEFNRLRKLERREYHREYYKKNFKKCREYQRNWHLTHRKKAHVGPGKLHSSGNQPRLKRKVIFHPLDLQQLSPEKFLRVMNDTLDLNSEISICR